MKCGLLNLASLVIGIWSFFSHSGLVIRHSSPTGALSLEFWHPTCYEKPVVQDTLGCQLGFGASGVPLRGGRGSLGSLMVSNKGRNSHVVLRRRSPGRGRQRSRPH